eukprot:g31241.t1
MSLSLSVLLAVSCFHSQATGKWTLQSEGPWHGAEGLMGLASADGSIYLSGGRGGLGKQFFGQLYKSIDLGVTWNKLLDPAPWQARAYHVHVELSGCQYIAGGQNWTDFYNDVWRSCDGGLSWTELVSRAPWSPRAGLAATVLDHNIYLCAGSLMPNFFSRRFYNDCWVSADGASWKQATPASSWSPRSGPRLAAFRSQLYLVGGEDGFSETTQYNDVWVSSDGCVTWKLVTPHAAFSPRSGHALVNYQKYMYVIAGYLDLHDMWVSSDGVEWSLVSNRTWNCDARSCGRFDFWAVVSNNTLVTFGGTSAKSTFGRMYDETYALDLTMSAELSRLEQGWGNTTQVNCL